FLAYARLFVIAFKFLPLFRRSISSNRRHVDHPGAEFNESPSLHRDVKIRNIMKDKVSKLLILFFTQPLDERVALKWLPETVCSETVLGKGEVEQIHN